MTVARRLRRLFLCLCLCALVGAAGAAQPGPQYVPEPGEIGKDVMWLPSDDIMVTRMLDVARVTARDFVLDLGSGDGKIVIAAARRGARALGVEYNPDLVDYATRRAARAKLAGRARFVQGDLFEADLSQASVITLFLLPEINVRLRPKLLELKPGTRIVSNSFAMEGWKADRQVAASAKEGCTAYCLAYLWIVPAKVAGDWKLPEGELTLKQEFQMITGTLRAGGKETAVKGRMNGDRISFTAGTARYTGRVNGDTIKGKVKSGGGATEWSAARAARSAS